MPTLAEYVASKYKDNTVRAWFESHDDVKFQVQTVCRRGPETSTLRTSTPGYGRSMGSSSAGLHSGHGSGRAH